tara:strand:+ start:902 stop:1387 length:486 start_codon:yes stop_codon:yes gene_type:complete
MVSPAISIERADNARRRLLPGYTWQEYAVAALKVVDETSFQTEYGSNKRNMESAMYKWEDAVKLFINTRCNKLGLWIGSIEAQLVEEPNESKSMELILWESRKAQFVWSIWAKVFGPVPEQAWSGTPMPLFKFWPREMNMRGAVPEIVDASTLSFNEQESK